MRNLHHLTCNNIAKLLVSYDTYLTWSMTKQIRKTRPAFNNVKPKTGILSLIRFISGQD